MKYTVVYLKPRTTYRPVMKSDTLWGALCWGIRMLYGTNKLQQFISGYQSDEPQVAPFYISSAFPYYQRHASHPVLYLPRPLELLELEEIPDNSSYETVKKAMRDRKDTEKVNPLKQDVFEYLYCDGRLPSSKSQLEVKTRPMAHNTINRITGSTLTTNNSGQLFHTEERFVRSNHKNATTGLYFLASGNITLLESVLRFLEHYGIGGDRSTGKGRFDISLDSITIKEPSQPNAMMNLSLYHPTANELAGYEKSTSSILRYKTIVRQGWKNAQLKKPVLYFEEGSVFPYSENVLGCFGKNTTSGTHEEGHSITQYGYGLMINLKLSANEA